MPYIGFSGMSPAKGFGWGKLVEDLGDFESIATVAVTGSNVTSITFSGIAGTYTHLQIRAFLVSGASANNLFRFNGDTGNNYTWHQIQGNGSSASGVSFTSTSTPPWGLNSGNSSYPMASIIDILDYANTNKYKTVRTLSGNDGTGDGASRVGLYSGVWMNTAAITSIVLINDGGSSIQPNSHFALYGIRSA
jgi:hypothetical protein